MQCPVCKTKRCVTAELEEHLKTAHCENCGGYWISHEHYETWLKHHGETLPEKSYSEVELDINDVQEAKICPDCGRILLKYKVGHGLNFFVDHCPGCGGVWLDTNEWEALQKKNLHDEIHKIFSTAWQNQIRGDQMAAKLDQAYSNRFGADTYQKAKDIRKWFQAQPQKQAILAYLADEDPYRI